MNFELRGNDPHMAKTFNTGVWPNLSACLVMLMVQYLGKVSNFYLYDFVTCHKLNDRVNDDRVFRETDNILDP